MLRPRPYLISVVTGRPAKGTGRTPKRILAFAAWLPWATRPDIRPIKRAKTGRALSFFGNSYLQPLNRGASRQSPPARLALYSGCTRLLRLSQEMRDDLFAEEAESVQHLLVLRRPDGAEQDDLLDAEGFI
jgi:hypothetical protein